MLFLSRIFYFVDNFKSIFLSFNKKKLKNCFPQLRCILISPILQRIVIFSLTNTLTNESLR
jgi:hypothetical protein